MKPIVGPELEFYVLERCETSPTGWKRYGEGTGNVYTSGLKGDPENTLIQSLRQLSAYGLDVVAANHEFSSGQFEINLWHSEALDAADRAFRFKTAVQELARMQDKLATFMAKPFNDEGGSGFHIHFSTWSDEGEALFDDPDGEDGLSDIARQAVAGVLAHAPALAALLNPTINSYKRFGPDTLAPWLIDWGLDNRSAMVRIPPERGRASRMELRLGRRVGKPLPRDRRLPRRRLPRHPRQARAPGQAGGLRLRHQQGRAAPRRPVDRDRRTRGRRGPARPARAGVRHRVRDLQAQRARTVLALGDRLGVP